jgi:fimbrial isopeptide formation D2 family protein/uncharacterized repeat protein (TIGR01451 family)
MASHKMNFRDKCYRLALPIGGSLAVLVLGILPKPALANLSITATTAPATLQSNLQGANVTISNVTLNQGTTGGQIGTFTGGTTGGAGPTIGIDNGVVIVTGDVNSALGPNNNAFGTTGNASDTFFDADLGAVTGTSLACKTKAGTAAFQCDTAVLEFDVVPSGSVLSLNFVFASEEYNEYVCSVFNDGFAIFVQGPGITGKQNIATVGGSRISINNINNGITGSGGSGTCSSNSSFFVQNTNITLSGGKASDAINAATYTNTQFDGFTKPLQSLIPVTPGKSYHIKIAIADVGDFQLDSGVFIDNITSYNFDFGDAPDSYGTTIPSSGIPLPGGARHSVGSDIYLGSTSPDAESNGTPATSPNAASGDDASGSDDEDAFSGDIAVPAGATSFSLNNIPVHNTVGTAKLMGWIDFNKNGVFDSGELATATVNSGAATANLSWSGLSGITAGTTYARFRLTTDTNLTSNPSPIGLAADGEVEDYRVAITPPPPDLTVAKNHTGNFTVGSTGTYSMSVGNNGGSATSSTITFTDTLPTGLTVNNGAAGAVTLGGTNAANWTCNSNAANPQVITCTSSTAITASGNSVFSFPVTVGLATAVGTNSITNTASVSGGGETNTTNDSSSDPTTILSPDLKITKTHIGNFTQGGTGAYTLTVGNTGTAATSGTVMVVDTLPTGLSVAAGTVTLTGTNAANWSCNAVGQVITCTSTTAISNGASSIFGFNVAVASNAPASLTNSVSVSGGNEATANNGNNSATDPTTVASVSAHANVLLVKRITAINGDRIKNPNDNTPLIAFVDDALANDNNANWPNPKSGTPPISNFLQGVINAGKVKPSDTIEYTIYFLNGDVGDATGVKICDRITGSQTLLTNAYGTNKDIQLHKGDGAFTTWLSAATSDLTSVNDTGDRAQLMATSSVPSSCHLDMITGGAADTGTLVIDITGTGNANQPNWSPLSGSTGPGIANSYGFIRFTTKVNP